jgi:hypothetical protein
MKFLSKFFEKKKPEVREEKPIEPPARPTVSLEPGNIVRFRWPGPKPVWLYDVDWGEDLWMGSGGETFISNQENMESALARGFWDDGFDGADIEMIA